MTEVSLLAFLAMARIRQKLRPRLANMTMAWRTKNIVNHMLAQRPPWRSLLS